MSIKITVDQLRDRLPELLDDLVGTGKEYIVQRNGKDHAVILSAQDWRCQKLGKRLDGLGPAFRLARSKQKRAEKLLDAQTTRRLTAAERRELKALLHESDAILLRRAAALDQLE